MVKTLVLVKLWDTLALENITSTAEVLHNNMTRLQTLKLIGSLVSLLMSLASTAKQQPIVELGIGVSSFLNPHYLGADQSSSYVFPFPYVIYRGDYIKADRSGLRGFIYDSDKLDVRMSFSGSLPVNSQDNKTRAGMENLDVMVEAGPNFEYQLYKNTNTLLRFDLPLRAAFSLGNPFMYHQGWTTNPRLYLRQQAKQWTFVSTLGVVFSDQRYHDYIYTVEDTEVTNERSYYQSGAGFTGTRFSISAKRQFGQFITGANMRYYNLSGAKNIDSPLIKQREYLSVGVYVAWVFHRSKQTRAD